jgi:hypothetical protein
MRENVPVLSQSGTHLARELTKMASHRTGGARSLADQVMELAEEVREETAEREKLRAERAVVQGKPSQVRQRATLIALVVSVPVLAILLVANLEGGSLMTLLTPAPSPDVARQQGQQALGLVVRNIEGFREDHKKLPDNLMMVGIPPHGEWTYTKLAGGHYQVALRESGQVLRFDSHQAKPNPKIPQSPQH